MDRISKSTENTPWKDVETEFKNILRADKEVPKGKLRSLTYKKGDDFQMFVDKYQSYCKQLNPEMKEEEIVKDLTRNIPLDMRAWILEKGIEDPVK